MDAKSTHICSSFTADPENSHIAILVILDQLRLIDRPDSQLLLHGRDQGWPLETGSLERVQGFFKLLDLVERLMKLDHGNVLFTSGLLGFDQTRSIVDADDETASDFGVESA